MLDQTLDVNVGVTPGQLADMMEMFITLLYLRKVKLSYWMDAGAAGLRGITLAQRIQSELNLAAIPGLPDEAKNTLQSCLKVSLQEIKELRRSLGERMKIISQMPLPGTPIH